MLTKAVCKGRRQKSTGGEACKPNVNGSIFLATSFKYIFFYSSSTLSLSSSSPISLLRYKASHPKLPPPHQPDLPPPLLLYLKLNHHTTTIDKIQETHTQNQSPRQKPRPNPHPNPPSPNPRNPYPKSIITTVKIHQAHGDGERENRKEKREKKKTGEERKRKERRDEWWRKEKKKGRKSGVQSLQTKQPEKDKVGEERERERERGNSMREK